ncbi:MAG: hypothetical protein A2156_10405 [Deltaproteobacteria bacterium RBG_16_48_10]|nr:MAG: hypothetical protein A2156_10405 [Deltaproteobacteria bacterium RBG_16_48_10]
MKKWIDFVAIVALASVGVIGSLLLNRAVPIPDEITLSLFGTGIISSVILIKIKYPLNSGKLPLPQGVEVGNSNERRI